MSINYYAHMNFVGDDTTKDTVRFHLAKMGNGFIIVNANHFDSVSSLVDFLRYNRSFIQIVDEADRDIDMNVFISNLLKSNMKARSACYHTSTNTDEIWLDDDGFSMRLGVWS